jgi:hypothetical protein
MQFSFLCNSPGSGKTRALLEGLARHWGFYFVAAPDQTRLGVGDIQQAFRTFPLYSDWVDDIFLLPEDRRVGQEMLNKAIANRLLMTVLGARVLVFKRFLQVAKEIRGQLNEDVKYDWLRFQLSEIVLPSQSGEHPFLRMEGCLRKANDEALQMIWKRFHNERNSLLGIDEFFLVFDEAQAADRRSVKAFMSSRDRKKHRSPLREVVSALSLPVTTASIIVSGTGLSLSSVHEAITSGAGKIEPQSNVFHLVHDFGGFYDKSQLETYMQQYLPLTFLNSRTGDLLRRRVDNYLRGR